MSEQTQPGSAHQSSSQLHRARVDYRVGELERDDLADDPFTQFDLWLREAIEGEIEEANAMSIATVDECGNPALRTVLLRGVRDGQFVFFTNYEGAKGRHIAQNSNVALLFHWQPMHRQVSVRGIASRVSSKETAEYFATRPRESRIGAWASRQSTVITNRSVLDEAVAFYTEKFASLDDDAIPVPPWWGGYEVKPTEVEFWQGRSNRLHDRFLYRLADVSGVSPAWSLARLSP